MNENAKEDHENYLSTLKTITDFICGLPNKIEAPDGPTYQIHNHQWPIRCKSRQHKVNIMAENLKDIDKEIFKDFEDLRTYVEKRRISYFGDTCIYDFSLRYGWNHTPRIEPKDYVYIHAKPRKSAEHLYNLGYIPKIDTKLPLSNYNALLRPGMTAADVEHFLCCKHKEIMNLKK